MTRITWYKQIKAKINSKLISVLAKNAVWPRPTSTSRVICAKKKAMESRGVRGKPGETGYRPLGKLFLFVFCYFPALPSLFHLMTSMF